MNPGFRPNPIAGIYAPKTREQFAHFVMIEFHGN
jgi:hypothetical protein